MRFRPAVIKHDTSGARSGVWLPERLQNRPAIREGDSYTEIQVDGQRRVAVASAVQMTAEFTSGLDRRAQLGHDCGVFALACESGDSLDGVRFGRAVSKGVRIGHKTYIGSPTDEPEIRGGDIILTTNMEPTDPLEADYTGHLMVRATVDEGQPLYLSKFGSGPVALSTLEASLRFYPATAILLVSGLQPIEVPGLEQT